MSLITGPMRQHIDGHKHLTLDAPFHEALDPEFVYIPLLQGNAPCEKLVDIGDEVFVGTKVAQRNDRFYVPLFSSVSGTVVAIEKFITAGLTQAEHIKIQNDHKYTFQKPFEPLNYENASKEEMVEFLKNAGIIGLGGAGFPTYVKYQSDSEVENLIINAVECEPYLTADLKNIENNLDDLKMGVLALAKCSAAKNVWVAIKEDKVNQIKSLEESFENTNVEIKKVPDVYPMGWERTLVYQLTGRRYNMLPMEAGCIINNASTVIAIGQALTKAHPITSRIITVSGDAIAHPQNIEVPVGMKVKEIIEAIGGYVEGVEDVYLIAGGPMMGKTIPSDEFVIMPHSNALTVLINDGLQEVNCLRCGRCTETCPSGLQPVRIHMAMTLKDEATLRKLSVNDCIECGTCSFVCPSKIAVTENVRKAKTYIRTLDQAKGDKR